MDWECAFSLGFQPMINASELAEDLRSCLKLAPHGISRATINLQLEKLRLSNLDPSSSLKETHALAALVKDKLHFFEENRVDALKNCEVYVVPIPLCEAYSKPKDTGNLIVIGSGLLNLICACGYWANFSESLPDKFDQTFPLKKFPNTSVRDAVPVFLFNLIYRYYVFGESLPDFASLAPESIHQKVKNAMAGATAFILFHELGHLELNHLENDTIRPMRPPTVVDEALSLYQRQELEAEQFYPKRS